MKEILLTSSVLILALLLLRLLFRKTISRQVQYALWGLVALRLLVPVSLPAMEHNVLTAAEPVTARITAPALYVTPYRETIVSAPPGVFQTPAPYQSFRVDTATEDSTVTFTDGRKPSGTPGCMSWRRGSCLRTSASCSVSAGAGDPTRWKTAPIRCI